MFTTMRRKRRSAMMKSELGQSVDHFKRAATLAAQETSATVGPKVNAARDRVQPAAGKAKDAASSGWESAVATLAPLITAASENARLTGKKTRKVSKKQAKANKKNAKKLEKRANKALGRKQSGRRAGKLFGAGRWSVPPSVPARPTWCASAGRAVGRVRPGPPDRVDRDDAWAPRTRRSSRPSRDHGHVYLRRARRHDQHDGHRDDGRHGTRRTTRWSSRHGRPDLVGAAQPDGGPHGQRADATPKD